MLTRLQRTQLLAFLQAEWIPMFADCTSASIHLSQVVRGHPRDLLQSLGGQSDAPTARFHLVFFIYLFGTKTFVAKWPRLMDVLPSINRPCQSIEGNSKHCLQSLVSSFVGPLPVL